MIIHTVASGDTIFKIARKYSVQPTKLLEENELSGDRLTVGEQLLILSPTRTVTVRGGDTLSSIARRFGVRRNTLLANNPALFGTDRLRPGQILSVKFDTPTEGAASAVGFFAKGCSERKLLRALPYLTYVVIASDGISADGIREGYRGADIAYRVNKCGKVPLLSLTDECDGAFLLSDDSRKRTVKDMIAAARGGGYKGVYLCAKDSSCKMPQEFCSFMLEARKQFIGCDLILFCEICKNTPAEISELADGAVILPSSDNSYDNLSELQKFLSDFSKKAESSKVFIMPGSRAYCNGQPIEIPDALKIADRAGAAIETDNESLMSVFRYNRYTRGKPEACVVSFPSLDRIKAMLSLCSELGYLGAAFDIDSSPVSHFCMFNAMFSRADYSLISD